MTALGWLFLILSLSFVWGLTGWCFYRVFKFKEIEDFKEPPASLGG
jgi:hypothetical protein